MGVYDQAARYLAKRQPIGFFRWAVPRWLTAFTFVGWHDTSRITFPGEPDRICDTVAEFVPLSGTGPRRLLDGEFQTEPDADILERLGEYAFRLRRELRHGPGPTGKFQVVSLLLNLTGPAQDGTLDMSEPALDGQGLRLSVVVRTLRDDDAAATLVKIAAGDLDRCVLPWVPLMAGAGEPAVIAAWKRLAERESDPRWRSEYGALALVFVELTRWAPLWRQALEGWNVRESPQVLEWQAQARNEGRTEGRAEGKLETLRQKLLEVLEVRLQAPVPEDVVAQVAAMSDTGILNRWFKAGLSVSSYDEFLQQMQR
jgi:hypothetical protein